MGTLSLSILNLRPLGDDYALVTGTYHLTRGKDQGGNAGGIFTLVFHKSDAGWRIISDHTS
jgi:ketosteroid isomerase-like protein